MIIDMPTTKTERFHRFIGACLQEDIDSLRGFPVKETSINFGISILMMLMATLHLVFSALQFGFSLVAVMSDLLVKGITKIMPAPKQATQKGAIGK